MGQPPRDGGARWGAKGRRGGKRRGNTGAKPHHFYGYRMHTSMNAESEMITSLVVTGGNANDGKHFPKLVKKDQQQGLPVDTYTADRGCDDSENHTLLKVLGM
ncbi:MAG: transposase, partial [Anaerolineae bacterium]